MGFYLYATCRNVCLNRGVRGPVREKPRARGPGVFPWHPSSPLI